MQIFAFESAARLSLACLIWSKFFREVKIWAEAEENRKWHARHVSSHFIALSFFSCSCCCKHWRWPWRDKNVTHVRFFAAVFNTKFLSKLKYASVRWMRIKIYYYLNAKEFRFRHTYTHHVRTGRYGMLNSNMGAKKNFGHKIPWKLSGHRNCDWWL